jgi:hypothetical protein
MKLEPNENGFLRYFKKESDDAKFAPSTLYAQTAVLADLFRLGPQGALLFVGDEFASQQKAGGGGDWQKITKDFSDSPSTLDLSSLKF